MELAFDRREWKFFSLFIHPFRSFFGLVFYCLLFFWFGFFSPFISPLLFRPCFVPVFWLMWFHIYPTPTCLGLKGLVVVVVCEHLYECENI
jgi:hypothetical protein